MEAYSQEDEDYAYEHDVRDIIEKPKKGTSVMSFYDTKTKTWEVTIDYGDYIFNGQVSPEGVPTEGAIIHDGVSVYFQNNKALTYENFKDTIIVLYQDGINKMFQEEANNNAFLYYTKNCEVIPEQAGESSSEEEGNVIHEEPTQPTQQPQNQSNLNLKSGQSRKFGFRKNE